MAWSLDKDRGVWICTNYTDLNGDTINKLAEFGEPFSPYEHPGFDPDFEPDFAKVVVEMPQIQVMTHGYGKNITAPDFPIVQRFLAGPFPLPNGNYSFDDLLRRGYAKSKSERWINTNLYGWGLWSVNAGDLDFADGAYVHGSVTIGLMSDTKFISQPTFRKVEAVIGAGNDNWDFESATIPAGVEATVATVFGPDHYNLEGPIQINFIGAGKRSVTQVLLQIPARVIPHP
jgi:hypothetical protein